MVIQIAEESLRLVADRLQVVLYINPQEMELVESRRDHLASLLPERPSCSALPMGKYSRVDAGWKLNRDG